MVGVGNLVANNAWAFMVAGLAAVLIGVAMLWALVQRKAFCERMQMLPLNDGSKEAKGETTHE